MSKFEEKHEKQGGRKKGVPNKRTIYKKAMKALGIKDIDDLDEPLLNVARKMLVLCNDSNDFEELKDTFKTLGEFRFAKKRIIDVPDIAKKMLVIHKTEHDLVQDKGGKVIIDKAKSK